ncbi:hypothetical protein GIB67_028831 [Kingdonia uniflora]|uniref:S1 motif domain-containing protein n=1 Tax=Kingdonia uniflora TaxID=39325 RepID=A0A7J7LT47_9MAGN|nr:hypothetical protein GIB67_028831 [Kingdonia uniflora]
MFSSARVGSLSTTTTTTTTTIPSSVSNPLLGCSVSLSRKSSLLQTLSCTLKVSSVVVATSAEKAEVAREDFSVGREDSSVGTTSEAIRQARKGVDNCIFSHYRWVKQIPIVGLESRKVQAKVGTSLETLTRFRVVGESTTVVAEVTGPAGTVPGVPLVGVFFTRSADWKAARAHKESGAIYQGKIEGFNGGGLLVRFYSLLGFLPYPLLSPSHLCKEPQKTLQEVAKDLVGSLMSVKVIQATEENRKLIFSEKEASWSIFAGQVNVGDVYEARVGSVEDYGAFVHLRFPDGYYHITGLVHVSEVSWDLVQDVRDILNIGDEVKVKVIEIDRSKLDPFHCMGKDETDVTRHG